MSTTSIDNFRFLSPKEVRSRQTKTYWLIEGHLDKPSLCMVYSPPGSGKTFLMHDMGCRIASGLDWHGHKTTQGGVLYLCGEGFAGISKRLDAWGIQHNVNIDSLPFGVSNKVLNFMDNNAILQLEVAIAEFSEQFGQPALIIIDTLSRHTPGLDENLQKDMSKFVSRLDRIRDTYGCSIIFVHHSGVKDSTRARGSTVLRAAIDWEYQLTKSGKSITLKCTKAKDFEPPPNISFRLKSVDVGDGQTSCVLESSQPSQGGQPSKTVVKLTPSQQLAFDILQELSGKNGGQVHIDDWRKACYDGGISGGKTDAKRQAFNRAVNDLSEFGLIDSCEDFHWIYKENEGVTRDIP